MYASLLKRFVSFLLDVFFIYSVSFFVLTSFNVENYLSYMILSGIISSFYFILFWLKMDGQTLGAKLVGIKVICDQDKLNFSKAFIRASQLILFIAPIGLLIFADVINLLLSIWTLSTSPYKEKKKTSWDVGSRTSVIDINRLKS
jgi:uncharacterized RDD family membrane protein YckC